MNMKEWDWKLVNYQIEKYNNYILAKFSPSYRICVDEIFSRWYGLGGEWVNLGLPEYMHMDCNPDDKCEIQNPFFGRIVRTLGGKR